MPGISGKQLSGDFTNYVSGSFKTQVKAGTLTADQIATLPNKTGTIALTSDIGGSAGGILSGASVAVTAIASIDWVVPANVQRLTLITRGLTAQTGLILQLGTSSGITITGYNNTPVYVGGASGNNPTSSIGLVVSDTSIFGSQTTVFRGAGSNSWRATGQGIANTSNAILVLSSGSVDLSADLTTVRLTRTSANLLAGGFVQLFWELPGVAGINLTAESVTTFTSVVPLIGVKTFPTQTVSAVIAFTLDPGTKTAGGKAIYRLIANGTNIPTFTGFTESGESIGYDNRNGILNVITFEWDGLTAWYKISQAKFALPSLSTIAVTFPSRQAVIGINYDGVNRYSSQSMEGMNFVDFMTSAQTIPSGKAGRITFKANQLMVVGFNTVSTLESYTNYEFMVFGSGGFAFTAIGGNNGAITTLSSGIAISTATLDSGFTWYRMTRNSSGTVTAECSTNSGATWQLMRTFAQTTTAQLWIGVNLSGNGAGRVIEFISIEIEP